MAFGSKKIYSPEQEEKRKKEIPYLKDLPSVIKNGRSASLVFEEDWDISSRKKGKPIPASIDYLFVKSRRSKGFEKPNQQEYPDILDVETEQKLIKSEDSGTEKKAPEEPEVLNQNKEQDSRRQKIRESIESGSEIDFTRVPLASEEEMQLLEKKHVNFYSILAKIQETHVASDFKSAYDIQDRISYLLNHRTLLYKDLVDELLVYMDSVIEKLEKYYVEISEKQARFKHHNKQISELNNYKFKTDESIKIIDQYSKEAEEELKKKSEYIKEEEARV